MRNELEVGSWKLVVVNKPRTKNQEPRLKNKEDKTKSKKPWTRIKDPGPGYKTECMMKIYSLFTIRPVIRKTWKQCMTYYLTKITTATNIHE